MVLCVVVVVAMIHSLISWEYHKLAERKFLLIQSLNFVDQAFFESYRVPVTLFEVNAILNGILFLILFAIILCLGKSNPEGGGKQIASEPQ